MASLIVTLPSAGFSPASALPTQVADRRTGESGRIGLEAARNASDGANP